MALHNVRTHPAVWAFALILLVSGCGGTRKDLNAIPPPDTSTFEPGVRAKLSAARVEFDAIAASHPDDQKLAAAYGTLAMTYHAQFIREEAELAYVNAETLERGNKRWPYLLAQLYADEGRVRDAITSFETVLRIDPADAASQVFLARLYLTDGQPEKAQPLFERALDNRDTRAAALTGLGKVALAERRYRDAADRLEAALALAPGATRLQQPLALAYRELGELAKADASLKRYSPDGLEPGVPDPALDEVNSHAAAYRSLLARAQYAVTVGRLDLAERAFREAVQGDPKNVEAMANLGITLANMGRIAEAQQWLRQAVDLDNHNATAHLSLGMVYDRQGLDQLAIDEYAAASVHDPDNLQAIVYRADAKMRLGASDEAAALYREALGKARNSPRVQMSLAIALVRARRFAEARAALEAALKEDPSNPDMLNALARILATAPQDSVRNGGRALEISRKLYVVTGQDPIVGQTYAMAFAEIGSFKDAIKTQQDTIDALRRQGTASPDEFLTQNLALYTQHKPSRLAWSPNDALFQPRSPAAKLIKQKS
jgi:Tfp pilus assembly protein PilF